MSWWKSEPKQDNGKSPAELSKNISQPVTEMIRRIDDEDRVILSPIQPGEVTNWYVNFMVQDGVHYSQLIVSWYERSGLNLNIVLNQDWMTEAEKSAIIKAVKRYVVKTNTARKLSEREEWCKLMGVNQ